MWFKSTFWNRYILAILACCFLFFLVFRPVLIAADALLRPLEHPSRLPAAIAVQLALIFLYFLTAAVTVPWLYRRIWPEAGKKE